MGNQQNASIPRPGDPEFEARAYRLSIALIAAAILLLAVGAIAVTAVSV